MYSTDVEEIQEIKEINVLKEEPRRCSKGIWDTTIPGIVFDENGACNYSEMFEKYAHQYPRGENGLKQWQEFVEKIKASGKNKTYDCIIGVSGGTDSSYLLHLAKEYGLRPLAVMLDNGWSSDISVKNIKKVTSVLDIDLETYVIDYEEIKDILCSYIKACLPWIDFPTDHAIKSVLYRTANREKIKHILIGQDFRSEGTQPCEWSYGDAKQLKYIQKKFGTKKIKSFPNMSLTEFIYLGYVKGIKMLYPFFFLDYQKKKAQELLIDKYDWEYYGGHHHENMFTKFAIAYWMPKKFNMDKRLITLSAQVMSGEISREKALSLIKNVPYDEAQMELDRDYTIKKLGMSKDEFEEYWQRDNKMITDYPSSKAFLERVAKIVKPFIHLILPQMPSFFLQLEIRNSGGKK